MSKPINHDTLLEMLLITLGLIAHCKMLTCGFSLMLSEKKNLYDHIFNDANYFGDKPLNIRW